MNDTSTVKITGIIAVAAVLIVGEVVGGFVIGEPTLLIPNETRAVRAELRTDSAEQEQRKSENQLNSYLHRNENRQ